MDAKYVNYLEECISYLRGRADEFFQEYSRFLDSGADIFAQDAFESYYEFAYSASVLVDVLYELKNL